MDGVPYSLIAEYQSVMLHETERGDVAEGSATRREGGEGVKLREGNGC